MGGPSSNPKMHKNTLGILQKCFGLCLIKEWGKVRCCRGSPAAVVPSAQAFWRFLQLEHVLVFSLEHGTVRLCPPTIHASQSYSLVLFSREQLFWEEQNMCQGSAWYWSSPSSCSLLGADGQQGPGWGGVAPAQRVPVQMCEFSLKMSEVV